MSSLFNYDSIKNHPSRSSFDLSRHQPFSAKVGEILPVYWKIVYPGDSFELRHQHFTRTEPVNTAAFVRVREYFDWYYVPLRLINKNIQQALVQMEDNPVQASSLMANRDVTTDIPYTALFSPTIGQSLHDLLFRQTTTGSYISSSTSSSQFIRNIFGFKTSALTYKLLHYLRFGNFLSPQTTFDNWKAIGYTSVSFNDYEPRAQVSLNTSILPLFAYQKIYADYFRFSQWEQNEPYTYNIDWYSGGNFFVSLTSATQISQYLSKNNLFTLRYCNWHKDMFMGLLPDQQLGDVAMIDTSNSTEQFLNLVSKYPANSSVQTTYDVYGNFTGSASVNGKQTIPYSSSVPEDFTGLVNLGVNVPSGLTASFNVIQLRLAESVQKWKEISQFSDPNYKDQLEAHWRVKLSSALSDRCQWIGGSSSNVSISEVENNNLVDGAQATLAGKGVGTGQTFEKASFDEHGILMCVYHSMPLLNYTITGLSPELMLTNTADFAIPELDRIGMQSLPIFAFANTPSYTFLSKSFPMGYLPRYYFAKTDHDGVLGNFLTTNKDWIVTLNPSYLTDWFNNSITTSTSSVLNYGFFKVNPRVMDSIFAVKADDSVDTDQLKINCFFDVKVVRNLDYSGMPY